MEDWKDIEGYEGLYMISSDGKVKSLAREMWNGKGWFKSKNRIMTNVKDSYGYYIITLKKSNRGKTFKVHRLIAIAFLNNSYRNETVNHKNGVKTDNRLENLEWMTFAENSSHAHSQGLIKYTRGVDSPHSIKVSQYDMNGNFIASYPNQQIAAKAVNRSRHAVNKNLKGINSNCAGFIFKYG